MESWSNQSVCMQYDSEKMECRFFAKGREDISYGLKLRISFSCMLEGEGLCHFRMVVVRWKASGYAKGMRISFWLEAEQDICGISPTLRYSLYLPKEGCALEEKAVLKVCREVLLDSFHIPWNVETVLEAEYLPVPFADHDTRPERAPLAGLSKGNHLYEGLLLHFGDTGLVIARVPVDRKPQWICLAKDDAKKISVCGISEGFVQQSDSEKEAYRRTFLSPEKACCFPKTRYMFFSGGENRGLYQYREFMKSHGIGMPQNYDPPFNYCVYYEYPGYFRKDELMKEADLAASLGCTLLYTDQGWEDSFGSGIWDAGRLGSLKEMVEELAQKGLKVGVLVGMHMKECRMPKNVWRRDPAGEIQRGDPWHCVGVCVQSPVWQRIKKMRLKKLAMDGIAFMSFDFNNYENVCYAKDHLHAGQSGEWEHAEALAGMQEGLKKECHGLLIEAHDWLNAGTYTYPVYLFPGSCQERWGFEYMWTPFEDFKAGRLQNLYYYNMAYEKPLYLHIDLADDNEHMAVFWYIASTVRHFGIGNFNRVESGRKALCREAISCYCKVREYLTQGTFWGINPLVHFHHLREKGSLLLLFRDKEDAGRTRLEIPAEEVPWILQCRGEVRPVWGPVPDIEMSRKGMSIAVSLDACDASVVWIG